MKKDDLALICYPTTHDELEIKTESDARGNLQELLVNPKTGQRFPNFSLKAAQHSVCLAGGIRRVFQAIFFA